MNMGPVVSGVLVELRVNQPEEAQRSIDNILKELEKQRQQKPASGPRLRREPFRRRMPSTR